MSNDLNIDDDTVSDYLMDLDLRIPKNEFFQNIIEDPEQQQQQRQQLPEGFEELSNQQHQQPSMDHSLQEQQSVIHDRVEQLQLPDRKQLISLQQQQLPEVLDQKHPDLSFQQRQHIQEGLKDVNQQQQQKLEEESSDQQPEEQLVDLVLKMDNFVAKGTKTCNSNKLNSYLQCRANCSKK